MTISEESSGVARKENKPLAAVAKIDSVLPIVIISMTEGKKEGESFYYRKDNCNITVQVREKNLGNTSDYQIIVKNETTGASLQKEAGTVTINSTKTRWTKKYTADDISSLGDGKISVTVTMADAAGNVAKKLSSDTKGVEIPSVDALQGFFMLDMTNPKIVVRMSGRAQSNGVYSYSKKNCAVEVLVSDANLSGTESTYATATIGKEPITGYATSSELKEEEGLSIWKKVFENEEVAELGNGELTINAGAEDFAGNKTSIISEESVGVTLDVSKTSASAIIDTSSPVITVKMSKGKSYDEDYYYRTDNCGITVLVEDSDLGETPEISIKIKNIETEEIISDDKGTVSFSAKSWKKKYLAEEISILGDGEISIEVEAKDAAGNMTHSISDKSTGVKLLSMDSVSDGSAAIVVLDMTSPTYTVDIEQLDGSALEFNQEYGRYFLGGAAAIKVLVKDRNLSPDAASIKVRKAIKIPESFLTGDFVAKDYSVAITGKFSKGSDKQECVEEKEDSSADEETLQEQIGEAVFLDSIDREGLFGYSISGEDLAGNPLVLKEDSTDGFAFIRKTESIGETDKADVTDLFVLDLTAPEVKVTFDNATASHGKYFKNSRTATIIVKGASVRISDVFLDIKRDGETYDFGAETTDGAIEDSGWNQDKEVYTRTITFRKDGIYSFHLRDEVTGKEDIVRSFTGKEGKVLFEGDATQDFVIDKVCPRVLAVKTFREDGTEVMGRQVYEDTKCSYYDSSIRVMIAIEDEYLDPSDMKGVMLMDENSINGKIEKTSYGLKVNFTLPENHIYRDMKVFGKDMAGNPLTLKDGYTVNTNDNYLSASSDGTVSSIYGKITDTIAPRVVKIETVATQGLADISDNKVYTDTNSVYYRKPVSVIVRVVDENLLSVDKGDKSLLSMAAKKDAKTRVFGKTKAMQTTLQAEMALKANHSYTDFVLGGADRAGNALVLAKDYEHASEADTLTVNKLQEGYVFAAHGKTIDTENPKIYLRYSSEDKANLYQNEMKGKITAYYNKDVEISAEFSDNYPLDGKKIFMGLIGNEESFTDLKKEKKVTKKLLLSTEGHYAYTSYGQDRAGNMATVFEQVPETDTAKEITYNKPVTKKVFSPTYELVIDKTAPVFTLAIQSPRSANQKRSDIGNRYYFNQNAKISVSVEEENYDANRIGILRGTVTEGEYNSATIIFNHDKLTKRIHETSSRYYSETLSTEGVYRYGIFGSDKAGNALVPKTKTDIDGASGKVNIMAKRVGVNKSGSLEARADLTCHVVIDKSKPTGLYTVQNGNDQYYAMNTLGSVTKLKTPFRREQNATVIFFVDASREHSPIRSEYTITSTLVENNKAYSEKSYRYHASGVSNSWGMVHSFDLVGAQKFNLSSWRITDLAGNTVSCPASHTVYLDKDVPNDVLAPAIDVKAAVPAGARNGHGQDLFGQEVPISITVTDPDGRKSSSGLGKITYTIYKGGKAEEGRKIHDDVFVTPSDGKYREPELSDQFYYRLHVSPAIFNHNDLVVEVVARDNAGHERKATYEFAIDVTAPKIDVSYDNNDAQNDKYFKKARTATVRVEERNFDPSRFSILTNGSVSGWTGPVLGNAANGDNDVWTATVHFDSDGEYTISTSGADRIGNQAGTTRYDGTAPREFVIDKTPPVVALTFDNNEVRNGKYYKADRAVTLSVEEQNFAGTSDVSVKAGEGAIAPKIAFSGNKAVASFNIEGSYSLSGTVTDLAGNVSETFMTEEFIIDKTSPEVNIQGVENLSANRDPLAIVLSMRDAHLAENGVSASLVGTNLGKMDISGKSQMTEGAVVYTLDELDEDDYYKLVFTGTDLAGNSSSLSRSFSVNQNGTVFVFEQGEIEGQYVNEPVHPSFRLWNVDEVTILSVTVNGREVPYSYGEGRLKLDDELNADGRYSISVTALDTAGNTNTMEPVEFVIDRTAPLLTVDGVTDEEPYHFEAFDIVLYKDREEDEFERIQMDGRTLGDGEYSVRDDGSVAVAVTEYADHVLSIRVLDAAGNASEKEYRFTLTRDPFIRWYSNKPLFFTSLAVIAGGIALLILLLVRRKSKKEN